MSIKREDLDHVRVGHMRPHGPPRGGARCYACGNVATILCDHPQPLPDGITEENLAGLSEKDRLRLLTCSRPCCSRHCCYWTKGKQLCKDHAEQLGVWA